MAGQDGNRFSLFVEVDENATPSIPSPVDLSQNPFLNQTGDDPAPWEHVKKRGVAQGQRAPQLGVKTLVIKDPNRQMLNRALLSQARSRTISSSTTDNSDKSGDLYVNWCGVCLQKFPSKISLLSHIKQRPEHQNYCNLCRRVFKDRNGVKNHVENSWGHEISCNLCLSAFKDTGGLKNHFENNNHVGHDFACLTCLLGFRTRFELRKHFQTSEKHTWCESCHRRFRSQDERDAHWQKTNKHKHCLQAGCDFDGPDEMTLAKHHREGHHQCVGCKGILPSLNKLNLHYKSCSFTTTCFQCGEVFLEQAHLASHLLRCYACTECGFHTNHEGNYNIHMTKHSSNNIPCWGCHAPMRTYSSLINHLESGRCSNLDQPTRIMRCLGKWWYSPLYMDIDLHAQLRTGRIDLDEMQQWIKGGVLHPFICRAEGCSKTFGHLSSLVLHCESQACKWDVDRLNITGLETEIKNLCLRNSSAMA